MSIFRIRLPEVDKNIKVTGKSVFSLYLTYKNHFEGRYDAVKYNFNTNISNAAYNKRRDKHFFERISKRYNFIQLVVLFMSNNIKESFWIGDAETDERLDTYRKFLGDMRKIKINFIDDIKNIFYFSQSHKISIKDVLFNKERSYLLRLVRLDIIHAESILLLDSFLDILDKYNKDDIPWNETVNRFICYRKLTIIDPEQVKSIFVETTKQIKES